MTDAESKAILKLTSEVGRIHGTLATALPTLATREDLHELRASIVAGQVEAICEHHKECSRDRASLLPRVGRGKLIAALTVFLTAASALIYSFIGCGDSPEQPDPAPDSAPEDAGV